MWIKNVCLHVNSKHSSWWLSCTAEKRRHKGGDILAGDCRLSWSPSPWILNLWRQVLHRVPTHTRPVHHQVTTPSWSSWGADPRITHNSKKWNIPMLHHNIMTPSPALGWLMEDLRRRGEAWAGCVAYLLCQSFVCHALPRLCYGRVSAAHQLWVRRLSVQQFGATNVIQHYSLSQKIGSRPPNVDTPLSVLTGVMRTPS